MRNTPDLDNFRIFIPSGNSAFRGEVARLIGSPTDMTSTRPETGMWYCKSLGKPFSSHSLERIPATREQEVTLEELRALCKGTPPGIQAPTMALSCEPAQPPASSQQAFVPPEMPPVAALATADNFRVFITTTRDTEDFYAREPRARTDALNRWHWREQGEYGTGMDAPWGLAAVSMDWVRDRIPLPPTPAGFLTTVDGHPVQVGKPMQYRALHVDPSHPNVVPGTWYSCTEIIAFTDTHVWTSDNGLRLLSNTEFRKPPTGAEQRCERLTELLLDLGTAKTNTEVARWVRDNVVGVGDAYTVVLEEFPADE